MEQVWSRFLARARMRNIVNPGRRPAGEAGGIVGARPPYPLLADRPDVLVFQTEPLEMPSRSPVRLVVNLWVSSSAVDTDFTAKLLDVYPPNPDYPEGYHMLIDSIIRCRYREGFEREVFMEPGEVYPVTIPCRRRATGSPPATGSGSTSPSATSPAST